MAIVFETTPCTRCGGSGKYSYNQINGDTCFKCGGAKVVLTKRGHAAKVWHDARQQKPAGSIVAGDWVHDEGRWRKVLSVAEDTLNAGYVTFTFKSYRAGMPATSTVRTVKDEATRLADLAAAKEYQLTLTKTGKSRK